MECPTRDACNANCAVLGENTNEGKLLTLASSANVEILGITACGNAFSLAVGISLDSAKLETDSTSGAIGAKVFANF